MYPIWLPLLSLRVSVESSEGLPHVTSETIGCVPLIENEYQSTSDTGLIAAVRTRQLAVALAVACELFGSDSMVGSSAPMCA